MIKKITVLAVLMAIILSGCSYSDYTEPENRTVVTAMLIKRELATYTVVLEAVNVEDTEKEEKYKPEYLTGWGESLSAAVDKIQSEVSSELSLFHCPLIICDDITFERNQNEIFDYLIRNPQISLAAYFVLADTFDYFIDSEKEMSAFLGYEITDMIELKNINSDIINILRGREKPPEIMVDKNNKYIFSEN